MNNASQIGGISKNRLKISHQKMKKECLQLGRALERANRDPQVSESRGRVVKVDIFYTSMRCLQRPELTHL